MTTKKFIWNLLITENYTDVSGEKVTRIVRIESYNRSLKAKKAMRNFITDITEKFFSYNKVEIFGTWATAKKEDGTGYRCEVCRCELH